MKLFLQMMRDPFEVINLREEFNLEGLPWVLVFECLKLHLLCNVREFAAKLIETLFIQGANCTLIFASNWRSTFGLEYQWNFTEHISGAEFMNKRLLFHVIADEYLCWSLCKEIDMRGSLSLLDYVVLWHELDGFDVFR